MAKYQIQTDNGTYEVETADQGQASPKPASEPNFLDNLTKLGLPTALGMALMKGSNTVGEKTAEALSSGISAQSIPGVPIPIPKPTPGQNMMNPTLAAGIGTGIQMTPDILAAMLPVSEAGNIAKTAKNGLQRAGNMVGKGIDLLTGQGASAARQAGLNATEGLQSRLVEQSRALGTLPERMASRMADLQAQKGELGKAIGKTEELGGFPFKQTPSEFQQIMKDPRALREMSTTMRTIAETPTEKFLSTQTPATAKVNLQMVRKFAQNFREVGPQVDNTIKANINMGGAKATEALKRLDPAFDSVLSEWEKVNTKINNITQTQGIQKAAIQDAMRNTRLAMLKTKNYYKAVIDAGAQRDTVRKIIGGALGLTGLWGASRHH